MVLFMVAAALNVAVFMLINIEGMLKGNIESVKHSMIMMVLWLIVLQNCFLWRAKQ